MNTVNFTEEFRTERDNGRSIVESLHFRRLEGEIVKLRAKALYEDLEGSDLIELMAMAAKNPKALAAKIFFRRSYKGVSPEAQFAFLKDDMATEKNDFHVYFAELNQNENYIQLYLFDRAEWESYYKYLKEKTLH